MGHVTLRGRGKLITQVGIVSNFLIIGNDLIKKEQPVQNKTSTIGLIHKSGEPPVKISLKYYNIIL